MCERDGRARAEPPPTHTHTFTYIHTVYCSATNHAPQHICGARVLRAPQQCLRRLMKARHNMLRQTQRKLMRPTPC